MKAPLTLAFRRLSRQIAFFPSTLPPQRITGGSNNSSHFFSTSIPTSSTPTLKIMTKETTPPLPTESTATTTTATSNHEPPSAPSSPLAKRTKSNTTDEQSQQQQPQSQQTSTMGSTANPLPTLLVQKLTPSGRAPTRGSAFAAGYDLYSAKDTVIPSKGKALVDTGIAIAVPEGTYGRIAPRSGLASKHFIDTGAGVIDADYRGEVKVLLFNFSDVDFEIKEGDRVAQLVLERIYTPEVTVVEKLEESVRGAGGFGSTGTN
ncbi:dUTP diphosphatase, partial [Aspergillus saccharolyticus JOP 1030-1]